MRSRAGSINPMHYRFSVCPSSRQGFLLVAMPCGVFMKSHQDRAFKGHPRGTKKSKSENKDN